MFEFYQFEDGTVINLYGVDSIRTRKEVHHVYDAVTGEDLTNDHNLKFDDVTEIIVSGYPLKLINISNDDLDMFKKALAKISNGMITKNSILLKTATKERKK